MEKKACTSVQKAFTWNRTTDENLAPVRRGPSRTQQRRHERRLGVSPTKAGGGNDVEGWHRDRARVSSPTINEIDIRARGRSGGGRWRLISRLVRSAVASSSPAAQLLAVSRKTLLPLHYHDACNPFTHTYGTDVVNYIAILSRPSENNSFSPLRFNTRIYEFEFSDFSIFFIALPKKIRGRRHLIHLYVH